MWQRFTERARKVVFYAQEEAQKFGEGYVSTEHLLLGLCREPDSVAGRVLDRLGVSVQEVWREVEKQLPRNDRAPSQDMTLTPRAKRVIDLAYDEARDLNNNYIGTEHLLLGLIREADGLAGRVLDKLGVELEGARRVVIDLQSSEPARSSEPAAPPSPRRSHAYPFNPAAYFHIRQGRYVAEHLFLMLVADPAGDAGRVAAAGLESIRDLQIETENFMLSLGVEKTRDDGAVAFQRILDRAAEEAKDLGHSRILLRHLLLALAFESDSFVHRPLYDHLYQLRQAAKDLPE